MKLAMILMLTIFTLPNAFAKDGSTKTQKRGIAQLAGHGTECTYRNLSQPRSKFEAYSCNLGEGNSIAIVPTSEAVVKALDAAAAAQSKTPDKLLMMYGTQMTIGDQMVLYTYKAVQDSEGN